MSIDATLDSGTQTLTINVSGRFDFGINQEFRKATDQAASSVKTIIVDLMKVDYLDSSALGMLLVLREKVGESKSAVKIKNAKSEVMKILKIANFDKLFTLE